jgi:dihydroflavonol-4-reductase
MVALAGRARAPLIVAGGYDWVDVRDVAQGTVDAALKGRTGEAYLLSREYMSNVELCGTVAKAAGVRAPWAALPLWVARMLSYGGLAWERVTGRRSLLTPYSVHTIAKDFTTSWDKAKRELGFAPRPLQQTLADAWQWLKTEPNSPLQKKLRVAPARQALQR